MASINWNGLSIHATVSGFRGSFDEQGYTDVEIDSIEVDEPEVFAEFLADRELPSDMTPADAAEKYSDDVNDQLIDAHWDR